MSSGASANLDNAGLAFGLVAAAGASTAVGAAGVFFRPLVQLKKRGILAVALGFASGVMLYVSFVEIFVESYENFLAAGNSSRNAFLFTTLCFFGGLLFLWLLTAFADWISGSPHQHDCDPPLAGGAVADGAGDDNPAAEEAPEPGSAEAGSLAADSDEKGEERALTLESAKLHHMGLKTALAIAIHNFPEGWATFVGTLADPAIGVTIAIAIGIHNIPEGISVALPLYYATGSRWKSFLWGMVSGVSEPIGALIGYLVIKAAGSDLGANAYGAVFGAVAGIMVMVVLSELLPTAHRHDPEDRFVTLSLAVGMFVMAASLVLFQL